MEKWSEVIALWPSVQEFARDLGVPDDNVRKWRRRNSIPGDYWAAIVTSAKRRNISLNARELLELGSKK